MCGIFAYYEPSPYVSHGNGLKDVISGLLGQVNRGQEGVGIVAFTPSQDNVFRLEKTDLSIDRVLNDPVVFKKFQKLNGSIILGHNRYATHGSIGNMHAQPMQNDPNGELPKERRKAIIFNGNIANEPILREELKRKGYVFQTDTDTEVLLALITDIDKTLHEGKGDIQTDYSLLFKHLDQKIDGACSLVLIDGCGNIVFYRDKNGIRPLVMSKLDDGRIIAASETSVLDRYKGKIISLEPGQIFFYDRLKNQGKFIQVGKNLSHFCSNEILYLGRPESEINGRSFYSIRHKIGGLLAEIAREKFQALTEEQRQRILITPIPNTGIPYGIGMAEGLGAPYELALTVNNLRRSFINAADSRENILKDKHSPIKDLVKDKTIWCVDDTVIRSSTARVITKKLLEAGAGSVEWFVGAPMFKGTCHYGLSVPNLEDLIYWKAIDSLFLKNKGTPNENKLLEDEIATLIGAKSITFLTTDQILEAFPDIKENFCTACFDLKYPTAEGERLFLERKKQVSLSTVNSHQLKA